MYNPDFWEVRLDHSDLERYPDQAALWFESVEERRLQRRNQARARRAGVSHSAPAHHFGDKNGLLAAFALEGFQALGAEMAKAMAAAAKDAHGGMDAIGMAYVMFAVNHPAHFDVTFRSGIHNDATPELQAAAELGIPIRFEEQP